MIDLAKWKAGPAQWGEHALVALAALLALALLVAWLQTGADWWAARRLARAYTTLTGVSPAPGAPPPAAGDELVKRLSTHRIFAPRKVMDLTGVLGNSAIFNNAMLVKAGEMAGDMKVLTIGPDWVEVESNGQRRKLYVFTSQGVMSFPPTGPGRP